MLEGPQTNNLLCPLCWKRDKKTVIMDYDEQHAFWRCPSCNTEVWPDDLKLKELQQQIKSKKLEQQMKEASKRSLYPDPLPLVPIINPKKRSSNKAGKKRTKPIKKKKFYELI